MSILVELAESEARWLGERLVILVAILKEVMIACGRWFEGLELVWMITEAFVCGLFDGGRVERGGRGGDIYRSGPCGKERL